MKALEKNLETRYQSAEEMLKDLRAVLTTVSSAGSRTLTLADRKTPVSQPMPTGALATLTQTFKRKRVSLGTFIIAIVLSGLAIWVIFHWWRPSPYKPSAAALDLYNRGTEALRNGAYYQASTALEQAVHADDNFALAHARLAEAWTELDYSDKAKDELLRAETLVHDRSRLVAIDALYMDAINATVTRDYGGAIKAYSEIVRNSPDDAHVYVDLGRAYEKTSKLTKRLRTTSRRPVLTPSTRLPTCEPAWFKSGGKTPPAPRLTSRKPKPYTELWGISKELTKYCVSGRAVPRHGKV